LSDILIDKLFCLVQEVFKLDASTSYFLKKYYPHVIKWWLVIYNPEAKRIWPSKAEKEEALRLETKKKHKAEQKRLASNANAANADPSAYNATTGSYSGLYGQKPVDEATKQALDLIMNQSTQSNQKNIDSLLSGDSLNTDNDSGMTDEQRAVIAEANAIYERLQREAAEDDAKKLAEIELAKLEASKNT
jgi:hypothetical protein